MFNTKINVPMKTLLNARNSVIMITADITPSLYMIGNRAAWNRLMVPNVRLVPLENTRKVCYASKREKHKYIPIETIKMTFSGQR